MNDKYMNKSVVNMRNILSIMYWEMTACFESFRAFRAPKKMKLSAAIGITHAKIPIACGSEGFLKITARNGEMIKITIVVIIDDKTTEKQDILSNLIMEEYAFFELRYGIYL